MQKNFPFHLLIYPDSGLASGSTYEDDGISFAYDIDHGVQSLLRFYQYYQAGSKATLRVSHDQGDMKPTSGELWIHVKEVDASPATVSFGGRKLAEVSDESALHTAQGWHYDGKQKMLTVRGPNLSKDKEYLVEFKPTQEPGK